MKIRKLLLAATSLGAGVLCVPGMLPQAIAQDVGAAPQTVETIVVTGIRGSLDKSATIKRDSKQIVDVITAEDVGKLPDNNVPEALAHVTGVQIERVHGEGSSVSIRGMTDVATTLNGNSASTGESRAMNLADIPAELLKSVTVYKSRTADQVEGGIAGTVNVDLRRPLDLPEGWTLAGSMREVNNSIGGTWSPYGSVLIADRFQTGIGEMGFLLNTSFTQNNYNENYFYNESPQHYWGATGSAQLATLGGSNVVPYASYYGLEKGAVTRPSVNISGQWRVNDNLDFVLEGTYFSSKDKEQIDRFRTVNDADPYSLSNVTYTSSGDMVKGMTYSTTGLIGGGPESYLNKNNTDDFTTNFETHWHSGRWAVDGSVQYNWSSFKYNGFYTMFRFNNMTSATVDFDSTKIPGGGPYISFNGVDLTNSSQYDLFQYHDEVQHSKAQELDSQLDATYHVSDDWLLRSIKVGSRYTNRHTTRDYGYRDANFFSSSTTQWTTGMPVAKAPCGDKLQSVHPDMEGAPTWYRISPTCLANNASEMRQFIMAGVDPATSTGTVSSGNNWTTSEPPNNALSQVYVGHEYSLAGYVTADWATQLYFPIDGTIGTRIVNTWGDVSSWVYKYDKDWNQTSLTLEGGKKDYTDVMPSANAAVHFTDKLQMRLSYFYEIQRPAFLDSSSWQVVQAANTTIYAGNPELKPMRQHSYDATIEYYFGKGGQISAGYFLKKPHGWIYYDGSKVTSGQYAGYTLYTNRNANPGTFEGLEFNAQSFFDFLPDVWSNFGASANFTLMTSYTIHYPYLADVTGLAHVYDAAGTSRYTMNFAVYYDTPEFSARLSYNRRAAWRSWIYTDIPQFSPWNNATSRLDAAVNYTPYKWMTLSLEASNLLAETNRSYWGQERYLPESVRQQGRTIQMSTRVRF